MTTIDFRPAWYRAEHRHKRETMIRLTILGVLAVELVLGSLGTFTQKAVARQAVATMRESLRDQDETLQHLGDQRIKLDELRKRKGLLSDIAGGVAVHNILAELSAMLPEAAVVTELRLVQARRIGGTIPVVGAKAHDSVAKDEQGRLEINGWASSNINVGTFMANLSASVLFQDIRLLYSNPAVMNGRTGREFKLTCLFPQYE